MLRSYLTVAWRNLIRHRVYSAINAAGMAVAIACCLLIFLFVRHEWTFDTFHEGADRIYRINSIDTRYEDPGFTVYVDAAVGETMVEEFPGVERSARMVKDLGWVAHGERVAQEWLYFADPEMVELFSFPVVEGDPGTAFRSADAIVLSDRVVVELFRKESALGREVSLTFREFLSTEDRWQEESFPLTVGAVLEAPFRSSL